MSYSKIQIGFEFEFEFKRQITSLNIRCKFKINKPITFYRVL